MTSRWTSVGRQFLISALVMPLALVPAAHAGIQPASGVYPGLEAATTGGHPTLGNGVVVNAASGDGRWVIFSGLLGNLLSTEDVSPNSGLYLYDRWNDSATLINRSTLDPNRVANKVASSASISRDGRYVVFLSAATDLVAGQVDGASSTDVFLYDRVTDSTSLVSHLPGSSVTAAGQSATEAVISPDGKVVFVASGTGTLVSGITDTSGADVFFYDPATDTNSLISRRASPATTSSGGDCKEVAISADNQKVAFASTATTLVAGQVDTNATHDIFVFDRLSQTTTLVSHTTAGPTTTPTRVSYRPVLSANGGYIAFSTTATTGMVAGLIDGNGTSLDAYLFELATGNLSLINHNSSSLTTSGSGGGVNAALMIDDAGDRVAYLAFSNNLVPGDTNGSSDAFLYDRLSQTNQIVGYASTGSSDQLTYAANGALLAFIKGAAVSTWVPGITDANATTDVLLYHVATGTFDVASRSATFTTTSNGAVETPQVSADGSTLVFLASGTNFETPSADFNGKKEVVSYDRLQQTNQVLTHHAPDRASATSGGGSSLWTTHLLGRLSQDGSRAIFLNQSANIIPLGGAPLNPQLYLFDAATQSRALVSHSSASNTTASNGLLAATALSRDGSTVVFASSATNHIAGLTDSNNNYDLFAFDSATGNLALLSRSSSSATQTANAYSGDPAVSADGRYVAFLSSATNLVVGYSGSGMQVYWLDRVTGEIRVVSHAATSLLAGSNNSASAPLISADGQTVVYLSSATNLVTGQVDTNSMQDIFLWEAAGQTNQLVSHAATSLITASAKGGNSPALSADGTRVAYASLSNNLVSPFTDNNGTTKGDVFLYDRSTGTNLLVSFNAGTPTATGSNESYAPAINDDGAWVAFVSRAVGLVSGISDSNAAPDVYLFSRVGNNNNLVSKRIGVAATGSAYSQNPTISGDGNRVAFLSAANNLLVGQQGGGDQIYRFDRTTGNLELLSADFRNGLVVGYYLSSSPQISADGSAVSFTSGAWNLIPNDFNGFDDVFVYDDP